MSASLDTLDLTAAELDCARSAVERMAYFSWLSGGCRDGADVDCWLAAEREWIEHCYVPHRLGDETHPSCEEASHAASGDSHLVAEEDRNLRKPKTEVSLLPA